MRHATPLRAGFTLLEVMISLAIFALVSYLLMDMLARQSHTYTVVDNVAEAQEKVRAVSNLIEQEVRSTGYLVPVGGSLCGYDTAAGTADTDPDVVYVSDNEPLLPPPAPPASPTGANERSATATLLTAGIAGTGTQTFQLSSLVLDGAAYYDLNGNGTGDSDFLGPIGAGSPATQRGGVIIFDPNDPTKGSACGQITNVDLVLNRITVDFTSGGAVPAAVGGTPLTAGYSSLAAVPATGYWINVLAGVPRLMRNGVVMAEDVEDLQLAAFFDALGDGVITALGANAPPPWNDATEYPGSAAANSWYVSGARDNSQLREIRVTIVARTTTQDPDVVLNPAFANSFPQRPENRTVAAGTPADGFRRRVIQIAVAPRNALLKS